MYNYRIIDFPFLQAVPHFESFVIPFYGLMTATKRFSIKITVQLIVNQEKNRYLIIESLHSAYDMT